MSDPRKSALADTIGRRMMLGGLALGSLAGLGGLLGAGPAWAAVSEPSSQLAGVIRIQGAEAAAPALKALEQAFTAAAPGVRFVDTLLDDANAFPGLCAGTADIAIKGQGAWRGELEAFGEMFGYAPLALRFATGSFNEPRGGSPCPVFFVNARNPLTGLTFDQLDGIFAAQRSGGWDGTRWTARAARGPGRIYRYWGQVGRQGQISEWNDRRIQTYGTDVTMGLWTQLIQSEVFGGGDKWNPTMMEVVLGDRTGRSPGTIVADLVEADWLGIGFGAMSSVAGRKGLRILALARREGQAYVAPSAATVQDGSYPLVQTPTLFVNRPAGRKTPPHVDAFLRFVLSDAGQEMIARSGTYLRLDARTAVSERAKLA